jgi:outer membrane lipoprotein carrier protein
MRRLVWPRLRVASLAGLVLGLSLLPRPSLADGLQALEDFLRGTRSGRAEFTQAVTAPAREGQTPRVRTSSGRFEFQRPERFRFAYLKPFAQTLVADGQNLWLHDPDLNQVTVRRQAQALASTPVALVASAPDLQALRQAFDLAAAPDRDGLQWVVATPRAADGAVREIRVGLRVTGRAPERPPELVAIDIVDGLGQRSALRFSRMEVNLALPPETFQFKPPAGADILRP